jgi:hypothetical protein
MSQIYRTDLFAKDTRTGPPGTAATGTTLQQHGDHVYTTKSTFEMTQFPNRQHVEGGQTGWRQEAVRGFVRELSTNISGAMGQARSASVQSAPAETTPSSATTASGALSIRLNGNLWDQLATQFSTSSTRFTLSGSPTIVRHTASAGSESSSSTRIDRDSIAARNSITERLGAALRESPTMGLSDRDIGVVDHLWREVGSALGNGVRLSWDDE